MRRLESPTPRGWLFFVDTRSNITTVMMIMTVFVSNEIEISF